MNLGKTTLLLVVASVLVLSVVVTTTTTKTYAAQDEDFRCVQNKDTGDFLCTAFTKDECKDFAERTGQHCVSHEKALKESDKDP